MDENVEAFLRLLDPADNSTGGGAASAVAGGMAAALVAMVARLSIGKEGLEAKSFYRELSAEAEALSGELLDGGREDSDAFMAVRSAYRLAKDTNEEKSARREAIQHAMLQAARVPLANMERCWRVLELAMQLQGRSNPNAASDLECALHLARAGLLGCADNVEINLPAIKDQEAAGELAERARSLKALALARLPEAL
ncbi:MAG: formiminotransferase-cyclodeaminase [Chloroflexi bacterium B3_Chlor]|nr:MAG: formiminotransferase-cyclodeaminase [Chloroflexi bacterium B3_Chlor]